MSIVSLYKVLCILLVRVITARGASVSVVATCKLVMLKLDSSMVVDVGGVWKCEWLFDSSVLDYLHTMYS